VIARASFSSQAGGTSSAFTIADSTAMRFSLQRSSSGQAGAFVGNPQVGYISDAALPADETTTIGLKWLANGTGHLYAVGEKVFDFLYDGPSKSPNRLYTTLTGMAYGQLIESILVYDKVLTDAEIRTISKMDRRWVRGSDGVIHCSLAAAPTSVVVRYI